MSNFAACIAGNGNFAQAAQKTIWGQLKGIFSAENIDKKTFELT